MVEKPVARLVACLFVSVYVCAAASERCRAGTPKAVLPPAASPACPGSLAEALAWSRHSDPGDRRVAISYCDDNPSPSAVRLVARMVADEDATVSNEATGILVNFVTGWGGSIHYTAGQLGQYGGAVMAKSLIVRLRRDADDDAAVQLLSCVSDQPEVRRFLAKFRSHPGVVHFDVWAPSDTEISVPFATDFALAQGGDGLAMKRIQAALRQGRLEDWVFLARSLWCVRNRQMLQLMLEFAWDTRDTREVPGQCPLCYYIVDELNLELLAKGRAEIAGVPAGPSDELSRQQFQRLVQGIRAFIQKLPAIRP